MTTLLLVRHGQSCANTQQRFAGHLDVELTPTGYAQAKATAQYIKENYNAEKVYASDLARAYETGKCIAEALNVEIIPDQNLREIFAGKWEGMAFADIKTQYAQDFSTWLTDIGNARCTAGESTVELSERVLKTLTEIAEANDGKTVVIATHATSIRVTQSTIQTGSLVEMKNVPWVSNASLSELEYNNGTWTFKKLSYDEHLAELRSDLPKNV